MIYTFRRLLRKPAFSAVAVLAIGLGTGVLVTMFTVVDSVLLRPLPYKNPDRLVAISHFDKTTGKNAAGISLEEFLDYRGQAAVFESIAYAADTIMQIQRDQESVPLRGSMVSDVFFRTLGLSPARGRMFTAEDYRVSSENTIVVSHRLWMEYFNGDPN